MALKHAGMCHQLVAHFFSLHFHTQLRLVINLILKALMLFIVALDG